MEGTSKQFAREIRKRTARMIFWKAELLNACKIEYGEMNFASGSMSVIGQPKYTGLNTLWPLDLFLYKN